MRTFAFIGCLLLGCHTASPPIVQDAGAAPMPATSGTALIDASAADPTIVIRAVVLRWNEAHNRHDVAVFDSLYAPTVSFFGAKLSRAECVKRKSAAFAKAPGFTQTLGPMTFKSGEDGGGTLVRFVKTTSFAGKATDYPAFLVVKDGHIIEESDNVSDENLRRRAQRVEDEKARWCLDPDWYPNAKVAAPLRMSAAEAWSVPWSSKHIADLRARLPQLGLDGPQQCPKPDCIDGPPPPWGSEDAKGHCGFYLRVVDNARLEQARTPPYGSIMVEWIYVDAIHDVLWFWSLKPLGWDSEKLMSPPPMDAGTE